MSIDVFDRESLLGTWKWKKVILVGWRGLDYKPNSQQLWLYIFILIYCKILTCLLFYALILFMFFICCHSCHVFQCIFPLFIWTPFHLLKNLHVFWHGNLQSGRTYLFFFVLVQVYSSALKLVRSMVSIHFLQISHFWLHVCTCIVVFHTWSKEREITQLFINILVILSYPQRCLVSFLIWLIWTLVTSLIQFGWFDCCIRKYTLVCLVIVEHPLRLKLLCLCF